MQQDPVSVLAIECPLEYRLGVLAFSWIIWKYVLWLNPGETTPPTGQTDETEAARSYAICTLVGYLL